jgi:hypothetical protein
VEEQKRHTSMAEIDALRCSLTCAECGSGILVNTQRMTKIEALSLLKIISQQKLKQTRGDLTRVAGCTMGAVA